MKSTLSLREQQIKALESSLAQKIDDFKTANDHLHNIHADIVSLKDTEIKDLQGKLQAKSQIIKVQFSELMEKEKLYQASKHSHMQSVTNYGLREKAMKESYYGKIVNDNIFQVFPSATTYNNI